MPITCKRHSQINHAGTFSDISKLSINFLVPIALGGRFAINTHCAAQDSLSVNINYVLKLHILAL